MFSVQCSVIGDLQCSFQRFLGDSELQSQRGTDVAQALFRLPFPRWLRLVLRTVHLPVFPRRHEAAVSERDRRGPSFVSIAVPSVAPTCSPSLATSSAPSSVSTAIPSCSPSAEPTAGPSYGPSLVPSGVSSVAPTCSPSSAPSLATSSAPSSVSTATPSCSLRAGPTWPELCSDCRSLGGSDLFFVQCTFQCFLGDTKLQSQSGTDVA